MVKLDYKKVSSGYIVFRIDGDRKQHSHFKNEHGCKMLIDFICKNKKPRGEYYVKATKRLLTEEEFECLKDTKQYYININKGVKKGGFY